MKREMRRKDRMISEEECLKALEEAEYGSLATISEDGTPYITPLNFVYTDGALYFHCAKDVGSQTGQHRQESQCMFQHRGLRGTDAGEVCNKVQIRNGFRNGRCCERRCRKTKCHRSAGVKNQSGLS